VADWDITNKCRIQRIHTWRMNCTPRWFDSTYTPCLLECWVGQGIDRVHIEWIHGARVRPDLLPSKTTVLLMETYMAGMVTPVVVLACLGLRLDQWDAPCAL
jgi:hypothetical protein